MNRLLPLALCLLLSALAAAQEAPLDPFGGGKEVPRLVPREPRTASEEAAEEVVPLRLRLEIWEASALEIAKRLDEVQDSAGVAKLRAACLAGVPGVSLVCSCATNVDGGAKTTVESITERIYPTEWSPPSSFPSSSPAKDRPADWKGIVEKALTETTPGSFETRNTGVTLEAVAQKARNVEKAWDVGLALDDVRMVGTETFGPNLIKITMPSFTSFRGSHQIRLKEGQWRILSMMEPPRGMEGKPSDQRWVTLVRIDREE